MHHSRRNEADKTTCCVFDWCVCQLLLLLSGCHRPDRNNHSNCWHTLLECTVFSLSKGLQDLTALVRLMACVFTAYEVSQLELTLKLSPIQHASKKATNTKYFQCLKHISYFCLFQMLVEWLYWKHLVQTENISNGLLRLVQTFASFWGFWDFLFGAIMR